MQMHVCAYINFNMNIHIYIYTHVNMCNLNLNPSPSLNCARYELHGLLSLEKFIVIYRYWLYAAVHCNCLLVTNDEMRDHLFQLLGTSFFPRWKEKHQVLHLPPSQQPKKKHVFRS